MIHRKCLQCGEFSQNTDKCEFCNTPFLTEKVRKVEVQQAHKQRLEIKPENFKAIEFINKLKKNPNIFISVFAHIVYSVFAIIFFVISVIAYIIATIAV